MELGDGASYLTEPPDSAHAMSPVTSSSLQILPLGNLTPANLERLCLRVAEKEGEVEYAGIYGVPGQAQHGIDVLARLADGTYRLIQSRRIQDVTPAGLSSAVDDFLAGKWAAKASSFVYATSASAARTETQDEIAAQTERLAHKGFAFDVWDDDRFSRKLKDHADLVADFFGVDVLRAFLPDQAAPALAQEMVEQLAPRLEARVTTALERGLSDAHTPAPTDITEGLLELVLVSGELPPDVKEILEQLRATSRTEAAHLASYVRDDPRRARDLIRQPQSWVERGSWQLLNALGLLAVAAGMYADAERAFLDAEAKSPARERALLLMRAHDSAENDQRPSDAAEHFARARDLDDQLIAVRLAEIRSLPDTQARLQDLAALEPGTDRERDNIDRLRVDLLVELDRNEEALGLLESMLERDSRSIFALDRRAGVIFIRTASNLTARSSQDLDALQRAAADSLDLRKRVLPRDRTLESGRLLARAAECLVLAGDRQQALNVLASATPGELAHAEVRNRIAHATLRSGEPSKALATLGDEGTWSDDDRLVAAHALALSEDRASCERATELARPMLGDEERAPSAALAIVIAAAFDTDMPWPDDAAGILAETSPAAEAHLHAERLDREGDPEAADRLLAKHADDPEIMRSLAERALHSENWGRGLSLAERLVKDTGRGDDRMLLARALKGTGNTERLKQELNSLVADSTQPASLRGRAFAALSAEIASGDFRALDELTGRWLRELPDDVEAQWQRVYALTRLARYEEALALIERHGLAPPTINHARLMASTFVRALKQLEAARRIADLSDQFDREDEGLEALVLFTATRTQEDADERLRDRIAETFRTFSERFPDSTAIQSFTVDEEDPESILEVLRSQFYPEREQQRREMLDQVAEGTAPLAFLATMVSRHIPQIVLRLLQVPLAYGHPEEWDRELGLARAAIGGPAVWDPTSLTIAAAMPEDLRDAVVGALPGSVLAYSSLQECDAADAALTEHDEEESIAPEGDGFRLTVVPEEEFRRERDVVQEAFKLARELTPVANVDDAEPDELDEFFVGGEERMPIATFPATISVARRRGLPIYSDDRYVRQMAHRARIETFGSVALLAALAERDDVDREAVDAFRLDLIRNGAVGLRPRGSEIAALAGEHEDEPIGAWLASIIDPSAWRNDGDEHLRQCLEFLRYVWRRRPALLPIWAARILDCAARKLNSTEQFVAEVALVYVWFLLGDRSEEEQRAFAAALFDALLQAPLKLGIRPFENLGGNAIGRAFEFADRRPSSLRRWMLVTIVKQLRYPYSAEALINFWRHV